MINGQVRRGESGKVRKWENEQTRCLLISMLKKTGRFFYRICAALVLFVPLLSYPHVFLYAQEESDTSYEEWENVDIGGFVRGEMHVPALAGDDSKNSFGTRESYFVATTELKGRADFTEVISAFGELRYRIKDIGRDVNGDSYIGHHANRDFDVRELYFRFRGDWLDISAGQQIIAWGVADGINPTDKLCPKNMTLISSDPDDRRLGILAVKGDLYLGNYTLTGVWQPIFTDSKFRLSRLPKEAEITVEDPQRPAKKLSNSTVAMKCSTCFKGTDVSLSYFYGWDPFPDIILDRAVTSDEKTEVWVMPVFNRIHAIGTDFSTVIGPLILRGEGAYTNMRKRSGKSPGRSKSYIHWITGLESECFEDFTVNVQYGMKHILGYESVPKDESEIENDPQAGVDVFNARLHRQLNRHTQMTTLRLDYRVLQDTLLFQFKGLYYINDEEIRLRPRIVYDINDYLEATLAAIFSFGPAGSRFHKSGENYNELFMELKYSF